MDPEKGKSDTKEKKESVQKEGASEEEDAQSKLKRHPSQGSQGKQPKVRPSVLNTKDCNGNPKVPFSRTPSGKGREHRGDRPRGSKDDRISVCRTPSGDKRDQLGESQRGNKDLKSPRVGSVREKRHSEHRSGSRSSLHHGHEHGSESPKRPHRVHARSPSIDKGVLERKESRQSLGTPTYEHGSPQRSPRRYHGKTCSVEELLDGHVPKHNIHNSPASSPKRNSRGSHDEGTSHHHHGSQSPHIHPRSHSHSQSSHSHRGPHRASTERRKTRSASDSHRRMSYGPEIMRGRVADSRRVSHGSDLDLKHNFHSVSDLHEHVSRKHSSGSHEINSKPGSIRMARKYTSHNSGPYMSPGLSEAYRTPAAEIFIASLIMFVGFIALIIFFSVKDRTWLVVGAACLGLGGMFCLLGICWYCAIKKNKYVREGLHLSPTGSDETEIVRNSHHIKMKDLEEKQPLQV